MFRELSYLPNRKANTKLGISLVPGSCKVLSVDKDGAANNFGVLPTWIVASIDGLAVDPNSAHAILAKMRNNTKRKKPWKLVFITPSYYGDKYPDIRVGKGPIVMSKPEKCFRLSPTFNDINSDSYSPSVLGLWNKRHRVGRRKPERAVAGNERLIVFESSEVLLGLTISSGTNTIESVDKGTVAYRMGVREGWNITKINGASVSSFDLLTKLHEAQERERFITVRFEIPHSYALFFKFKKILTKPISDVVVKVKERMPGSTIDQLGPISYSIDDYKSQAENVGVQLAESIQLSPRQNKYEGASYNRKRSRSSLTPVMKPIDEESADIVENMMSLPQVSLGDTCDGVSFDCAEKAKVQMKLSDFDISQRSTSK